MRFTGCSVLVEGKGNSLFKADTSLQTKHNNPSFVALLLVRKTTENGGKNHNDLKDLILLNEGRLRTTGE